MWLPGFFRRRAVTSSAEAVDLRGRRVWVKPANARFIIDASKSHNTEDPSNDEEEKFLIDMMRESVIDEKGNKALGEDPLAELDWQEFNRLRDIVMRWNTFSGDAEKN